MSLGLDGDWCVGRVETYQTPRPVHKERPAPGWAHQYLQNQSLACFVCATTCTPLPSGAFGLHEGRALRSKPAERLFRICAFH